MATEEELKRALKAFKKRLKLTRLDDESGLSRGGGKKTGIMGITPPSGHPPGDLGGARELGQTEAGDVQHLFPCGRSLSLRRQCPQPRHGPGTVRRPILQKN